MIWQSKWEERSTVFCIFQISLHCNSDHLDCASGIPVFLNSWPIGDTWQLRWWLCSMSQCLKFAEHGRMAAAPSGFTSVQLYALWRSASSWWMTLSYKYSLAIRPTGHVHMLLQTILCRQTTREASLLHCSDNREMQNWMKQGVESQSGKVGSAWPDRGASDLTPIWLKHLYQAALKETKYTDELRWPSANERCT